MARPNPEDVCVIFDLDGTLVDSETLCNQAFIDLLPELDEPVESLVLRFQGRKLAAILLDLEELLGQRLPPDFESRYRLRVSRLFQSKLEPIPGVIRMLSELPYSKCIATSGPPEKAKQSLSICRLAEFFGPNVFSAYEINSWKPDPGLFLHAAKRMGCAPSACVVIEDSAVGIEAASAAGMQALWFQPRRDLGLHPIAVPDSFTSMEQLPGRLALALAEM